MVKGFRYKLYSTVSDSDQLKKEEKVIFIVIALLLGRSITIKLSTWQKKLKLSVQSLQTTREYGSLWIISNI